MVQQEDERHCAATAIFELNPLIGAVSWCYIVFIASSYLHFTVDDGVVFRVGCGARIRILTWLDENMFFLGNRDSNSFY